MPSLSDIHEMKEGEQLLCHDDTEIGTVGSPRSDPRSLGRPRGVPRAYLIVGLAATLLGGAVAAVALGGRWRTRSISAGLAQQEAVGLYHRRGKGKDKSSREKGNTSVGSICAGEGEDCSHSQCCLQAGMQCYEQQKGGAAFCKATCKKGPEFSHSSFQPWTCEEIGQRTEGKVSAKVVPASKLKFEDLPGWVVDKCTEHGDMKPKDCSHTMCCKDPGMQCFEKEHGWAICDTECAPGKRQGDGYWQCDRLGPKTPVQCPTCSPKSAPKPDIVILFFERDLCKMKYTARSIGVNDPDHNLGEVYLMWVSSHSASEYQGEIDEITSAIEEYKTVHFVDWSQRMAEAQPHPIGGWHAQQMVKLKIAHKIKSEFYIVLDSKNTLIRPVTPDMFFTDCGQGIIQAEFPYDKIPVPHSDWYARSAEVLGVDPPDSGFWPASITPIVMHKATVIEMLKQIGEDPSPKALCNGPLCDRIGAFSDSGVGATEFTLYTLWAYAKRKNDTFGCIHSIEKLQHFRLNHTEDWRERMHHQISGLGFPEDLTQITTSDSDGWPLDWTPDQMDSEPTADKFPLMFEDLTRKWASSLWRGEKSNKDLLVQVNLHTLDDVVSGVRQFPLMFGAQPASLKPMSKQERVMATDQLVEMYKKANLYDPDDDLVDCTIGWKN